MKYWWTPRSFVHARVAFEETNQRETTVQEIQNTALLWESRAVETCTTESLYAMIYVLAKHTSNDKRTSGTKRPSIMFSSEHMEHNSLRLTLSALQLALMSG